MNAESRCKNCKWWDVHLIQNYHTDRNQNRCENPKLDDDNEEFKDGAVGGDIGSYYFYTGPDFGCIHFEPK